MASLSGNTSLEKSLEQLGFTGNEIRVYLALMRMGNAKAGRIARECSLERTSVYNALKRLIARGVVSSVRQGKIQRFSVGVPEKILSMVQEQEEIAKLVIPQLQSMKRVELEKERILKFRGYQGVKTVLMDTLESCTPEEEFLILGSEGQISARLPTFSKIYVGRKDRKKLRARILVRKGRIRGKPRSIYTKQRYVPQDVISPASIAVYHGKVSCIIWRDTPEAIIIDDADVATTFKNYFEFMWKHAEKG